jgi:hypothetical protein
VNTTTRKLHEGFAESEEAHSPAAIKKAIALYKKGLKRKPRPKKETLEKEVKQATGIPPRTLRYHLAKEKGRRQ